MTSTPTPTLTERYIAAVVRSLRPETQDDVRSELAASISDAVDARVEQGEAPADAERAVLTELGDPGILAAEYADRPLYLIGPRYFLTWWRLLKLLLIIVPLCAAGGVALGLSISGAPIGEVIGQTIAVVISVIVHLVFWTTLVFAILERSGTDTGVTWDVDQLPEPQHTASGRGDMIAMLVLMGVAALAVLWDAWRGIAFVGGQWLPALNRDAWAWTIAALLVIIAAEAVLAIVVYARGRWTVPLAVVNTVIAVCFVSLWVTLLARGELFAPSTLDAIFLSGGGDPDVLRILAIILGFGITIFAVLDIVDAWRKTARAARRDSAGQPTR